MRNLISKKRKDEIVKTNSSIKNENGFLEDSFDELLEAIDFPKIIKDKFKFSNNLKSIIC